IASSSRAGITRRWSRGVVRILLEALQQALDGGLQRGDACCEGADILLDGNSGCSHSDSGHSGRGFMGLDHTRLDTGWQVSHTTTTGTFTNEVLLWIFPAGYQFFQFVHIYYENNF